MKVGDKISKAEIFVTVGEDGICAVDYKEIKDRNFCERVSRMNKKDYQYKPGFMRARAAQRINSQAITFDF